MNISEVAPKIEHLNYVVMRKWDYLPLIIGDDDVDFFVSKEDYDEMDEILKQYIPDHLYDLRTNGDNYFAKEIEDDLLLSRRQYNGFWIPSPRAHFLSLYYHNLIHKGDDRYHTHLKRIFINWLNPQPPEDKGVGYHVF